MIKIRKSSVILILFKKIEELKKHKNTLYYDTDGKKIKSIDEKIALINELFKEITEPKTNEEKTNKDEMENMDWFKKGLDSAIKHQLKHYGTDLFMELYNKAKKR